MRGRVTDKSSILLLGRNTVIFGAVVIFAISLGVGYFLGYKGSSFGRIDKQESEHGLPLPPATSPEDKRILEPPISSKPVPFNPKMPSSLPPEAAEIKPEGPAVAQQSAAEQTPKQTIEASQSDIKGKGGGKGIIQPEIMKKTAPESVSVIAKPKEAPSGKKRNEKGEKAKVSAGKLYTVQFGAFPSKEGAMQLRAALKAKGISTYIVNKTDSEPYYRVRTGSFKNRKEADLNSRSLQKKTGMPNFVTFR
jgi:cell division protein FtsN